MQCVHCLHLSDQRQDCHCIVNARSNRNVVSGRLMKYDNSYILFHCGRPTDGLVFCLSPFLTPTLYSSRCPRDAPSKIYHRLDPRPNSLNSLRHFAYPSPIFTGGQKVPNLAYFRHQSLVISRRRDVSDI